MGVTYAYSQCISGMGRKSLLDAEQGLHHGADLLFSGLPVTADRFLYLCGRILVHGDPNESRRQERHPSGLSEHQGGSSIPGEEHLLHGHVMGLELPKECLEFYVDLAEPFNKRGLYGRTDRSVCHVSEVAPFVCVNDAEACVRNAWIDSHHPHGSYPFEQRSASSGKIITGKGTDGGNSCKDEAVKGSQPLVRLSITSLGMSKLE